MYQQSSLSSFAPLAEMRYPRCGVGLAAWDGKLIAVGKLFSAMLISLE